uniref:S1 motif domain-containing protein n=1 Tax=viral metagenome TaxID=1070528 RepID=A0A6C0CUZ4_9ZZZZ
MNNDSFVLSLLNEKVKLSAKYLNKNYKQYLLKLLQDRNEGKCSKHGYIKKGSIEIKRVSVGALEIQSLRGFVNYDIQFSAMVCNPTKGSILKCTVLNSNNFGVLCVCGLNNGPNFVPIIDIIIPKNSLTIRSDSDINVDTLQKGDVINVEIIGKKFEINDSKISAVGRIVELKDDSVPLFDVENNEIDPEEANNSDNEEYEDDFDEEQESNAKFKDDEEEPKDDSEAEEEEEPNEDNLDGENSNDEEDEEEEDEDDDNIEDEDDNSDDESDKNED